MIGMDRHNLPCPIDRSQEALWSALRADFPKLRDHPLPIRLARNGEFLQAGESLAPGDEIALIPPVSGG
jgi:molybdopterin converting factor small subunit